MKKRVLAVCGSIRSQSSNMGIILALEKLSIENFYFEIFRDIQSFPHFSPDLAIPETVLNFKNKLKNADVLIISTPEYAHGIPGVLKNALDWIVSDEDFPGKVVGLVLASTGDGLEAKRSLVEILRTMSAQVEEKSILNISGVRSQIGKDGHLLNEHIETKLSDFLKSLR
jgi:NAD(P)H-dependent FMN reductase